jgi:ribose transport system substrate-binding protein
VLALLQSKQCRMRQPGVVIDSGSFLVTKQNVDGYDAERQKTSEQIKQRFAGELLACG